MAQSYLSIVKTTICRLYSTKPKIYLFGFLFIVTARLSADINEYFLTDFINILWFRNCYNFPSTFSDSTSGSKITSSFKYNDVYHEKQYLNNKKVNPINYYFNDLSPGEYDRMIELSMRSGQSFD